MGLFSAIGSLVGGIFGGGSRKTTTAPVNYNKMFTDFKNQMTEQMNFQTQENKKMLMFVGIGAIGLVLLIIFMKK